MEDKENKVTENQETPETQEDVQPQAESVEESKAPSEETAATPVVEESKPEEEEVKEKPSEAVDSEQPEAAEAAADQAKDDEEDHDDHDSEEQKLLETLDFHDPDKKELYEALKKFAHVENMRVVDKALKEIRPLYDKIYDKERNAALEAFVAIEGNDSADFDFKGDEIDTEFFDLYEKLRAKKSKFFAQLEKSKDENLAKKEDILERLRELVDGEESTASINTLKELQNEWKTVGQVPGAHVKTLWANYNALIDRFYDHRSIYFELKELDRKKNLQAKLDLCERAEALDELENMKEAIFQLNELHEEFKHIGPIPKDDQEPVWQRFKAASDKIYAKRKEYFDHLKKDLAENADKKQALGDEAQEFTSFNSDRITEWNAKTKEILELQKRWDKIGGLPRDRAKEINKHFWGNFKQFFANKSAFFKTLESQREENLKKKEDLLAKAEALKESDDFDKTANELKKLQSQWREIGPVPEKQRNVVYKQFKAACDHFFERRREKHNDRNKEFEVNLKKKEDICSALEAYINSETIELDQVYDLLDQYAEIGFVPRNSIKKMHARYDEITNKLIALEDLTDSQRSDLEMHVQVSKLKNSPHSGQKIHRKEGAIKRKISNIENDIATWKTNMEFFAASKNAEQLKADFKDKIARAEQELEDLKKQLDVLNEI